MKIIRLNWLELKNFKGIKDLHIDMRGLDTLIVGDNATYKTTTYDAYSWLISGKDSFNHADFGIKPLDDAGKEIHFLETSVEAELLIDKPLKLKKVQTENWVKPHGQTEQIYKGNNTAYFFDDVPVGANEYKRRVDELIGEEVFRLLTNPLYFNLYYKLPKLTDWQSRRALLFEMNGEITDDEIITRNPKLAKLPEVLNGKSIDDRKAVIAQSIKKLNDQIEKIGPAINENTRLIPLTPIDYTATEAKLATLKSELDGVEKELADAGKVAGEYRKKQQELYGLKGQLENVKNRIFKQANSERQKLVDEKSELTARECQRKAEKGDYLRQITVNEKYIADNNDRLSQLRQEWTELHSKLLEAQAQTFTEPDEENMACPTCGQELPQNIKDGKINELKEKFERNKESQITGLKRGLETNKASGLYLKQEVERLQNDIGTYESNIETLDKSITAIIARIEEIDGILAQPSAEPDYAADPEYAELSKKITNLQTELDKPIEDTTVEARQRKANINADIEECNSILNNKRVVDNAKARIEELKQSERDLSNQKSQLEGQLNLITEFIKAKADTLTDIMNSKFKHVRFELFTNQITNNALVECCNTLVNTNGAWVPFSDGNTAGKINAGIDIVNALSEHYGVRVPLWVDNRESITELAGTDSQVISLIKPYIPELREKLEDESEADYKKFLSERAALIKKYSKLTVGWGK